MCKTIYNSETDDISRIEQALKSVEIYKPVVRFGTIQRGAVVKKGLSLSIHNTLSEILDYANGNNFRLMLESGDLKMEIGEADNINRYTIRLIKNDSIEVFKKANREKGTDKTLRTLTVKLGKKIESVLV